jgi:hypothetical protein
MTASRARLCIELSSHKLYTHYTSTTVADMQTVLAPCVHWYLALLLSRSALSQDKKDKKEPVKERVTSYTEIELESLDTPDPLWNAAHASVSTELVYTTAC